MAETKEYVRWAITGNCGLYVGQYLTRQDAIADHVWHRDVTLSKFAPLDDKQLAVWQRCKSLGDKAVKVRILVPVGSPTTRDRA